MSDEHIPDGPFTKRHPMTRPCGSKENHGPHKERKVQQTRQGPLGMWYSCPGWQTTHTVTVTAADGTVVGTRNVDLRELTKPDRYLGTNSAELTLIYDARMAKRELTADELTFGAAVYAVAPEVCPYDCDRCHTHLYDLQSELDGSQE